MSGVWVGGKKYQADLVRPKGHPEGRQARTVYVGNLPWKTTNDEVEDFFADCGYIEKVHMPRDEQGNARGFAFIHFETRESVPFAENKSGENFNGR